MERSLPGRAVSPSGFLTCPQHTVSSLPIRWGTGSEDTGPLPTSTRWVQRVQLPERALLPLPGPFFGPCYSSSPPLPRLSALPVIAASPFSFHGSPPPLLLCLSGISVYPLRLPVGHTQVRHSLLAIPHQILAACSFLLSLCGQLISSCISSHFFQHLSLRQVLNATSVR